MDGKNSLQLRLESKPSHGGLEVERLLRIQLKASHSYLSGFESRLGHGYVDVICNNSVDSTLVYYELKR